MYFFFEIFSLENKFNARIDSKEKERKKFTYCRNKRALKLQSSCTLEVGLYNLGIRISLSGVCEYYVGGHFVRTFICDSSIWDYRMRKEENKSGKLVFPGLHKEKRRDLIC